MLNYRCYNSNDLDAVAEVYRDAVCGLGINAYSKEQVDMWASFTEETQFKQQLSKGFTIVAEMKEGTDIVAFAQLEPINHIALLYTKASHASKGIGAEICTILEKHALSFGVTMITTHASKIARPFFEKLGYNLVEAEMVNRNGVLFERFKMRKQLAV